MLSNIEIETLSDVKKEKMLSVIKSNGYEYGIYPLTSEQTRMWFLYLLNQNESAYQGMCVFEMTGWVDKKALKKTVFEVLNRHSILRTTYMELLGHSFQVVNDKSGLKIDEYDLSDYEDVVKKEKYSEIIKKENKLRFNLKEEFPIKFIYIKFSETISKMLIKLHHICFDGWSLGIIVSEFYEIYDHYSQKNTQFNKSMPYQYFDYALWQKKHIYNEKNLIYLDYWINRLRNTKKNLSFLYENKSEKKRYGVTNTWADEKELSILKRIAAENKTSLFSVTLTLFYIVLSAHTNQNNINVGVPVFHRPNSEFAAIVGYFSNTVVLNAELYESITFIQLLEQVKHTVIDAMEKQDVPFESIVDGMKIERSLEMTPLFQVMFSLQNKTLLNGDVKKEREINSLKIRFDEIDKEYVENIQYKMMFTVTEYDDKMGISLGYNTILLSEKYMELFIEEYKFLISVLGVNSEFIVNNTKPFKDALGWKINSEIISDIENDNLYFETFNNERLEEVQETIISIWKELIQITDLKVTDKFFEVGGNSNLSIIAIAKLNKAFNLKLEIVDLFKYKTVEELAKYIVTLDKKEESTTSQEKMGLSF